MPIYDDDYISKADDAGFKNRASIEASEICGCYSCLHQFPPAQIEEWTDGGQTALCPRCDIDSVIGSASGFPINSDFLQQMCQRWFGEKQ